MKDSQRPRAEQRQGARFGNPLEVVDGLVRALADGVVVLPVSTEGDRFSLRLRDQGHAQRRTRQGLPDGLTGSAPTAMH